MAAAEFLIGAGYINGVQGAITMTPAGGSDLAPNMNIASRNFTDNFKTEEIPSQNGATIEAVIACQRYREYDAEFAPKGTTRALCFTFINTFLTVEPLAVITIAQSSITTHNGTYNYMGGAYVKETRDGYAVGGIKLRQYETAATAGTFAALAKISG